MTSRPKFGNYAASGNSSVFIYMICGEILADSEVFAYHWGENGTPVIDASPVMMECDVADIRETEDFDLFICSVANTYTAQSGEPNQQLYSIRNRKPDRFYAVR